MVAGGTNRRDERCGLAGLKVRMVGIEIRWPIRVKWLACLKGTDKRDKEYECAG